MRYRHVENEEDDGSMVHPPTFTPIQQPAQAYGQAKHNRALVADLQSPTSPTVDLEASATYQNHAPYHGSSTPTYQNSPHTSQLSLNNNAQPGEHLVVCEIQKKIKTASLSQSHQSHLPLPVRTNEIQNSATDNMLNPEDSCVITVTTPK